MSELQPNFSRISQNIISMTNDIFGKFIHVLITSFLFRSHMMLEKEIFSAHGDDFKI